MKPMDPTLVLWNASDDSPITTLEDGGTIDLCLYEDIDLNLEVNFADAIDSVTMTLKDYYSYEVLVSHTESALPYMLGGDINRPFSVNPLDELKVPGVYYLYVDPEPGPSTYFYFYVHACDYGY